jgi:hypothetical protein
MSLFDRLRLGLDILNENGCYRVRYYNKYSHNTQFLSLWWKKIAYNSYAILPYLQHCSAPPRKQQQEVLYWNKIPRKQQQGLACNKTWSLSKFEAIYILVTKLGACNFFNMFLFVWLAVHYENNDQAATNKSTKTYDFLLHILINSCTK